MLGFARTLTEGFRNRIKRYKLQIVVCIRKIEVMNALLYIHLKIKERKMHAGHRLQWLNSRPAKHTFCIVCESHHCIV